MEWKKKQNDEKNTGIQAWQKKTGKREVFHQNWNVHWPNVRTYFCMIWIFPSRSVQKNCFFFFIFVVHLNLVTSILMEVVMVFWCRFILANENFCSFFVVNYAETIWTCKDFVVFYFCRCRLTTSSILIETKVIS